MDDLVAYLKTLGNAGEIGVTSTAIRILVPLPPKATAPELNAALRAVLSAFFDDVNHSGLYGRRLDIRYWDLPSERPARAMLAGALETEPPFVVAAAFLSGIEEDATAFANEHEVPVLAAFSEPEEVAGGSGGSDSKPAPISTADSPGAGWVFHLGSQTRALSPREEASARGLRLPTLDSARDSSCPSRPPASNP